ncbi:MAG: C1 family peptidase [Bacteroidia bacterium]|nr:C1 family peptidase [Bacteroidia bacterium]
MLKFKFELSYLLWIILFATSCGHKGNSGDPTGYIDEETVTKGCSMDTAKFRLAKIFEPLSKESEKNRLPASASLHEYAPRRVSQGSQGSCVAFSSAYAARTILECIATGKSPDSLIFSPAFLYNQIRLSDCSGGSYIQDAMEKMMSEGVVRWQDFPYDPNNCDRLPNQQQKQSAKEFKIAGYNRLTRGSSFDIDLDAIKQNIAKKAPVVVALPVGGTFDDLFGSKIWKPTPNDYKELEKYKKRQRSALGGHAMCLIGYNDNIEGGSVEIMNSWGSEFGESGIFWMPYKAFYDFCIEAWGLFPLPSKIAPSEQLFKVSCGLVRNKTKEYISLEQKKTGIFITTDDYPAKTKFKIEINNTTPCYAYVLGQETNESSYILFPYTQEHSPYCGITGTRLFPSDYSLVLDNIGKKDYMAIILSLEELDIQEINKKINDINGKDYADKINKALKPILIPANDWSVQTGETVDISVKKASKNTIAIVFEILKK